MGCEQSRNTNGAHFENRASRSNVVPHVPPRTHAHNKHDAAGALVSLTICRSEPINSVGSNRFLGTVHGGSAPDAAGSTVTINPTATVGSLKCTLSQYAGVRMEQARLVLHGRNLDETKTLGFYNIKLGDNIKLRTAADLSDARGSQLQDLIDQYEITIAQEEDLAHLAKYDIVFLIDDSGSMGTVEVTAGVKQSRWQEMRDTVTALIDFACIFDDDGTDVHFFNQPSIEGVTDPNDPRLQKAFAAGPKRGTPLIRRFREVVESAPGQKPLLVVIATDGEPTDGHPSAFIDECRKQLTKRRDVRLAVMACTQDDNSVAWLNDLDDDPKVGNKIDVCDDYEAEKTEVLAAGRVKQFLVSDYYVKALLGPILSKYDLLDTPLTQQPKYATKLG